MDVHDQKNLKAESSQHLQLDLIGCTRLVFCLTLVSNLIELQDFSNDKAFAELALRQYRKLKIHRIAHSGSYNALSSYLCGK